MAEPSVTGWVSTGLCVVHPWHCDAMGHLTTRHYLGFFDDATHHMMATCGYVAVRDMANGWGWADVRHEIDYRAEANVGALLELRSRIVSLGRSSVASEHLMLSRADGRMLATLTGKTVAFDTKARRAMPLPDTFRSLAEGVFGISSAP